MELNFGRESAEAEWRTKKPSLALMLCSGEDFRFLNKYLECHSLARIRGSLCVECLARAICSTLDSSHELGGP